MKCELHGNSPGPAIGAIGVWDPLLGHHRGLLSLLRASARKVSKSALIIAIDPDPGQYVSGRTDWPVYNDVRLRAELLCDAGADAVLAVHFSPADIDLAASDLFELVQQHCTLSEVWLGATQTLGRGPKGNASAIDECGRLFGFSVKRLRPTGNNIVSSGLVRHLLHQGRLAEAVRLVGAPPVWQRPPGGVLRLPWPSGAYEAASVDGMMGSDPGSTRTVTLHPEYPGRSRLLWETDFGERVSFRSGPADRDSPEAGPTPDILDEVARRL
jgi:FAD synthetase